MLTTIFFALIDIIAIAACGLFDRYRGDDDLGRGKNVDAFIQGIAFAWLALPLGTSIVDHLIFAALFVAAMAISYGGPWGAVANDREFTQPKNNKWDWWMIGALRKNEDLALLVRALIGAGILSLYCFNDRALIGPVASFVVAFCAAPYLSRYLFDNGMVKDKWVQKLNIHKKQNWNLAELLRGLLMGTVGRLLRGF